MNVACGGYEVVLVHDCLWALVWLADGAPVL